MIEMEVKLEIVWVSPNLKSSEDCLLPVLRGQRLRCCGEQWSLVRRRLDGVDGQLRRDGHGGRGSEGGLQLRHRHLEREKSRVLLQYFLWKALHVLILVKSR